MHVAAMATLAVALIVAPVAGEITDRDVHRPSNAAWST